eukprot:scaffold70725_cov68-Phaeocystis_antarctica.AAC.2
MRLLRRTTSYTSYGRYSYKVQLYPRCTRHLSCDTALPLVLLRIHPAVIHKYRQLTAAGAATFKLRGDARGGARSGSGPRGAARAHRAAAAARRQGSS